MFVIILISLIIQIVAYIIAMRNINDLFHDIEFVVAPYRDF